MSNTIRFSGMASGIDTESIISSLMDVEMVPITSLEEEIAEDEEKYEAWSDLETKLSELKVATGLLENYTTWRQYSAEAYDEDIVSATAGLAAKKGTYSVNVQELAQSHRIGADSLEAQRDAGFTTAENASDALGYSGEFTVGGQTVTVTAEDSLANIRDLINEAAGSMDSATQVSAYLVDDTLVVERVETGDSDIEISETGAENSVLRQLGIVNGAVGDAGAYATVKNELQESRDLTVVFNGVTVTESSNTGLEIIDGLTVNFLEEGSTTLSVEADSATVKDAIQDFITIYNDTIDLVDSMTTVILNDDTSELEAYGVLQGEYVISQMETKVRSIVMNIYNNTDISEDYNSLYSIGIWSESDDGKLQIVDEDKLDDALDNHFEDVEDLFRAYPDDQGNSGGIFRELEDYIYSLVDPVEGRITMRQESLQDQIDEKENKVAEKYSDLEKYEEYLWEHYAAMEEMVSDINSQWEYVESSLGI